MTVQMSVTFPSPAAKASQVETPAFQIKSALLKRQMTVTQLAQKIGRRRQEVSTAIHHGDRGLQRAVFKEIQEYLELSV